ncbi:GGDEF domain-containing protein [Vibrio brasiliensis]
MQVDRHFSLKFVFLAPMVWSLVVLALTLKNHYDAVNRDIDDEYTRVVEATSRAAKVVAAIDYSFSNHDKNANFMLLEHNRRIVEGLCQMWPIDALLRSEGRDYDIPAVDINYMLVGRESLCTPGSDIYQRVSNQVSLAPILSFLHDIDGYLLGIHYIDRAGYVMSSPDDYAKSLTVELLDTIQARPYWHVTASNRDKITLSGPAPIIASNDTILSMTMPVYLNDVHQGMLSLDISYQRLLATQGKLAGELHILNTSDLSPPDNAFRLKMINIEGVASNYALYYLFDVKKEIRHFFYFQRYSLLVTAFIYVFSVVVLFLINTRVEQGYFRELAATDPMTGLLNRRGLEAFLTNNALHGHYIALGVFDIDDFKKINDNHGHDVGDTVIKYMAEQISLGIRSSDAAARIGGEEFVIYMTGNAIEPLKKSMLRVRNDICQHSEAAVENGFTVSGGVEVVEAEGASSFEVLFKAADEKLYQAKNAGKDQLVF